MTRAYRQDGRETSGAERVTGERAPGKRTRIPTGVRRAAEAEAAPSHDLEDDRYFLDTFAYYVASLQAGSQPERQDQGSKDVDGILDEVLVVSGSIRAADAKSTARGVAQWQRVRREIKRIALRYQAKEGHLPETVAKAEQGIALLDTTIMNRRAEDDVTAGAASVAVDEPLDAYYAQQAPAMAAAIEQTFEYYRRFNETVARMGVDIPKPAVDKLDAFTTSAAASITFLRGVHSLVVQAPKIFENFKAAKKNGDLPAIATLDELFAEGLKAIRDIGGGICAMGEVAFPTAAAAFKAAGEALKKLTTVLGALQVIAGALRLIDAMDKGDARGIGDATHTILQGVWAVSAYALGLGTGVTAGVSATLYLWYQGYLMMGQLGGVLQDLRANAGRKAIKRLIDSAQQTADDGRFMASAMKEFLDSHELGPEDPELQATYVKALLRIADEQAEKVRTGLKHMKRQLESRDPGAIGMYPALVTEFPMSTLDEALTADPLLLADKCHAIYSSLEKLGKDAVEESGAQIWVTTEA
jgi:hypothetical protein